MWNNNAYIIGNREALHSLRNAIDHALQYGETKVSFFPTDIEMYDLYICCLEGDLDRKEWANLQLPYHDPNVFNYNPNNKPIISPHKVFMKYKYLLGE